MFDSWWAAHELEYEIVFYVLAVAIPVGTVWWVASAVVSGIRERRERKRLLREYWDGEE